MGIFEFAASPMGQVAVGVCGAAGLALETWSVVLLLRLAKASPGGKIPKGSSLPGPILARMVAGSVLVSVAAVLYAFGQV